MFDFRRITLFCLEKHLSKRKMTIFSKNLGGHGHFGPPATPMTRTVAAMYADGHGQHILRVDSFQTLRGNSWLDSDVSGKILY